jgi:hypothetical protein
VSWIVTNSDRISRVVEGTCGLGLPENYDRGFESLFVYGLRCPVQGETLRWTDRSSRESYQTLKAAVLTFWHLRTPTEPLNHYWKPRTPKPFLRFEPQNNTQPGHNKQIHKLRNILFNSQTKKYTKNLNFNFNEEVDAASQRLAFFNIWFYFWNCCAAPTNQGKGTSLICNLQFQIPSLFQSVFKFSISDFAFLQKDTLLICRKKIFNFLNSRGSPE